MSDWHALRAFADAVGSRDNPVVRIIGKNPPAEQMEHGGAIALAEHHDEFEGVRLSDGDQIPLD